jgi:hypothetical protein
MFGLVRHEGSEVAAHYAVPRGAILLVKVRLNVLGDILLFRVCFQSRGNNRHGVVLHKIQSSMVRSEVHPDES